MSKPAFVFKPFVDDKTPHSQLQEWADYYGVKLVWKDEKSQTKGITKWTSYPIIEEYHYSKFTGSGPGTRESHRVAAELIINSKGTL
ncbi:hypothetical protein FRC07_003593 [Ceratobasidium sp. 392]|nr:hypothetical protein FRC07_003593 [Ceratobasidium sp. 392]